MDAAFVVPVIITVAALYLLVPSVVLTQAAARKTRRVKCPENDQLVDIRLDAARATRHLFTDAHLAVAGCSRWPSRAGCEQHCLGCG